MQSGNAGAGSAVRRHGEGLRASEAGERLERSRAMIQRFLRRRIEDRHVVEDLVQETLMRGFRYLRYLREPEAFEGWLLRIAFHVAMDWHRKSMRGEVSVPLPAPGDEPGEPGWVGEPPDCDGDRQRRAAVWQRHVRGALRVLPGQDRAFLIAHYFVGLTCRQISERSGLSLANVKVRMHRARRTLRKYLPPEQEFREWIEVHALPPAGTSGKRPRWIWSAGVRRGAAGT